VADERRAPVPWMRRLRGSALVAFCPPRLEVDIGPVLRLSALCLERCDRALAFPTELRLVCPFVRLEALALAPLFSVDFCFIFALSPGRFRKGGWSTRAFCELTGCAGTKQSGAAPLPKRAKH
jgi:hypothetical protein